MKLFLIFIMATYYVALSGNFDGGNAGSDAAAGTLVDPWLTSQKALDTAVAGDTVNWLGTQVLTAIVDVDTNSGSIASGLIKHIGVNSAGNNTGVMAILDGNSAVANCIRGNGRNYVYFENIEVKGSTSHGWTQVTTECRYWIFVNCLAHNCGGHGFNGTSSLDYNQYHKCRGYSNTSSGWGPITSPLLVGCVAYSNSVNGFAAAGGGGYVIQDCLVYSNTTAGITLPAAASTAVYHLKRCTLNNNATGVIVNSTGRPDNITHCRITNNATAGISLAAGKHAYEDWNAFGGNGTDKSVAAGALLTSGPNSQTGITVGYTDAAGGDFNLTSAATLRRTANSLDGTNINYETAGLIPTDSGGGGGSGSIIIYDGPTGG